MALRLGPPVARKVLILLLSLPLAYLAAATAGGLLRTGGQDAAQDRPHRIHLLAGPIHYDLLLPLDAQTRAHFDWLRTSGTPLDLPGARWLVVGWGARGFYTTTGTYRDVSPIAIWRGLTGDSTVLRIELGGALPQGLPLQSLDMTGEAYRTLLQGITDSFAHGVQTQPLPLPGFSQTDSFYPAKGRFHLFNTCNVWIGRVLRAAGVRFGIWTPLPYSVTLSLQPA